VIRGGGQSKTVHQTRPATIEELAVIAANMREQHQLAVLIAAWCGLRQGELLELRRKDIDLKEGVIRVRRAVVRVRGQKPVVDTPKSDAGIRDVAIPPHLIPEFERHLDSWVPKGADHLLFPGEKTGEQLPPSSLYGRKTLRDKEGNVIRQGWGFLAAREAAGRTDLRWHDLRHTGATLAAATGATLSELMARIGHSTPAMALRYQHAASDRDKIIAGLLSEMVKPAEVVTV
jgi:integrase